MARSEPKAAAGAQGATGGPSAPPRRNPLLAPSALPFQAPPFDAIADADFEPAFAQGIHEQLAELAAIVDNPAPPTFENTIVALERSGQTLTRVSLVFNALTSANTNEALQAVQQAVAPKLAAQTDAIYLNGRLFARVDALYARRATLDLDAESRRLLEYLHQQFVMAGARRSDADQTQLKALNEEEASLDATFTAQLLAAANGAALVVLRAPDLAGLPAEDVASAAEDAKSRGLDGRWLLTLQNTTQQPALQQLTDRATRERLYRAGWTRAEGGDANDTRATVARIAAIRALKARLLGQPSYAAWRLQDQMAKTPEQVQRFLHALVPAATKKARAEAAELQAAIDAGHGGFTLEPWDWDYYAERARRAALDLGDTEVRPYFVLDRVLEDGVFYAAHELYGLTFTVRHDVPVYHPDVRVFEVLDHDGSHLGLLYCDFFRRDNKSGGAWMDNLTLQSGLFGQRPIVTNVANFTKPAPGQPALLSFDDVRTMFHEFGHALHGLLADQRYASLSGTAVARDFVEFPSQINEHWALDPKVLARYARHHRTGQPMPAALADKIRKAETFNQGYALVEVLAAAQLDMHWHTLPADSLVPDVDRFEADALAASGLDLPQVPPRYRSSSFLHIWANGYAAGYYAYLWAEMLEDDAADWFDEHGGLTRENGQRLRDLVLSRGNTEDYAKMFRDFRGREPSIEPMLRERGIK